MKAEIDCCAALNGENDSPGQITTSTSRQNKVKARAIIVLKRCEGQNAYRSVHRPRGSDKWEEGLATS